MVDRLEMPHPFASLRVETEQTFSKKIIAGNYSIEVLNLTLRGYRFQRHVHVAKVVIGAHHRPRTAELRVFPGIVQVGVITKFSRVGNYVKRPEVFSAVYIETAKITGPALSVVGRDT